MKILNHLIKQPNLITLSTKRGTSLTDLTNLSELKDFALIQMEQVHSSQTQLVSKPKSAKIANVDALITTRPKIALIVRTADCLPILFYHPWPLIGVIHAGRKGTKQQITLKTLNLVKDLFHLEENLQLWFGPAICQDCYQVDPDLDLRYDLVKQNTNQVKAVFPAGGAEIINSNLCTSCHNHDFHSYRKEGKDVELNYSLIGLKKSEALY